MNAAVLLIISIAILVVGYIFLVFAFHLVIVEITNVERGENLLLFVDTFV